MSEVTRFKSLWREKFTDEQKAQFFSWFNEASTTNEEIRTRLKQRFSITLLYDGQLSDLRSWAFQQQRLDAMGERMAQREAQLTEEHPEWSREKIRGLVLQMSYAKSIAEDDMVLGLKTVREDTRLEVVSLAREQWEMETAEKLLDKAVREAAEKIANSGLSRSAQIAAMRKAAFADVDEMERSGAVKLPDPKR